MKIRRKGKILWKPELKKMFSPNIIQTNNSNNLILLILLRFTKNKRILLNSSAINNISEHGNLNMRKFIKWMRSLQYKTWCILISFLFNDKEVLLPRKIIRKSSHILKNILPGALSIFILALYTLSLSLRPQLLCQRFPSSLEMISKTHSLWK